MTKSKLKYFVYFYLFCLFLIPTVFAQSTLSDALKQLQVLDLVKAYFTIPSLIDFIALFTVFYWISRKAFEKREFPKQVHLVLAGILALSAVILLNQLGKNLYTFLKPLLLLFLVFGAAQIFLGKNKTLGLGLGFLALYNFLDYLKTSIPAFSGGLPFPFGLLQPIFLIAGLILLIIGIFETIGDATQRSRNWISEHNPFHRGGRPAAPPGPAVPPAPGAPNDAIIRRLQGEIGSLGTDIVNLNTQVTAFNGIITGIGGAPARYPGTNATHPRTTITTLASHIISEVRRIRGLAHDIQVNDQFMNLAAADRAAFTGHVTNLTRLYAAFMTDYTNALLRW
jgi:hypothetical protein